MYVARARISVSRKVLFDTTSGENEEIKAVITLSSFPPVFLRLPLPDPGDARPSHTFEAIPMREFQTSCVIPGDYDGAESDNHDLSMLARRSFPGRDKMRDAGGPVLVRGRGDVDGRHEDGEQSRRRRRQSREYDVSGRCPTWAGYTHVDAARGAARAATSSDESRDERCRERQSPAGASAEEAGPQKKVGDDTHP